MKTLKKPMMNNKEINIFIENNYEYFLFPEDISLENLTKQAVNMTKYFMSQTSWLNNSCLDGYDFNSLYFDIVFVDDTKIREINKEYRQKDSSTDVITFAIFADSPSEERFIFDEEINLGEIIISLDKTKEQASLNSHNNNTFKDELLFLFAHGILHLLGYDHLDEASLQVMWDMQQKMINN